MRNIRVCMGRHNHHRRRVDQIPGISVSMATGRVPRTLPGTAVAVVDQLQQPIKSIIL